MNFSEKFESSKLVSSSVQKLEFFCLFILVDRTEKMKIRLFTTEPKVSDCFMAGIFTKSKTIQLCWRLKKMIERVFISGYRSIWYGPYLISLFCIFTNLYETMQKPKVSMFMTGYESCVGVPMTFTKMPDLQVWHMFIREFEFTHNILIANYRTLNQKIADWAIILKLSSEFNKRWMGSVSHFAEINNYCCNSNDN